MSNSIASLMTLLLGSAVMFVLARLVRVRGPRGLINGVDWERVSDAEGLGRFAGNVLVFMGLAMIASGIALLVVAVAGNKNALNIVAVGIAVWTVASTIFLLLGILRYQDKAATRERDGSR